MKTVETKLFSFRELSPEAQESVIERITQDVNEDPDNFTLDECMDSLKAIVSACGCRLSDWQIGPYNRSNFARVDHGEDWDGGHRTMAWFCRVLMDHGYSRPKRFTEMEFPGICGFTGVCFDKDIAEEMWSAILEGESLSKAADRAADKIQSICEDDLDYRTSREGILEYVDQSDEIYTEEGEEF